MRKTNRNPQTEPPETVLAEVSEQMRRIREENRELFQRLVDGERRLRNLARAVWRVQEDERRRMSRDLHDGVGQMLTALKMQIERFAARAGETDPELAEDLLASAGRTRQILEEARRLSHQLHPRLLVDLGLAPALRWLSRTLEESTGFRVGLRVEGAVERRLEPEIESLVFRVVQEGLNNALKHSGASGAEVHLEIPSPEGWLSLRVRDEGRGFDPETLAADGAPAGSGLRGIRDRVEVFGGRLEILSRSGEGTRLEVTIPLDSERQEERIP